MALRVVGQRAKRADRTIKFGYQRESLEWYAVPVLEQGVPRVELYAPYLLIINDWK